MVTSSYKPKTDRWTSSAWGEAHRYDLLDKWAALREALEEKINLLEEQENKQKLTDDEWNDIMAKVN